MRPVVMLEEGGRGGVGDYTVSLVEALAAHGVAVEVVTATDHELVFPAGVRVHLLVRYVRATTPAGAAVRRMGLGRAVNGALRVALAPRLARIARRGRLLHIQGGELAPITLVHMLAARAAGVPIVHTPHNTFDRPNTLNFVRTRRAMLRVAARTILHARADLEHVPPRLRSRCVIIPHGDYGRLAASVPPVEPDAARAELGIPSAPVVALLFGQLRLDKGVRDLLTAARDVPELVVVLAGEELGALAEAADLLADPALAGRVVIREGHQSMTETAKLFAAADVVVLPYRQASASGVLLLAYAFRRPVVVYPVGGLPESVEDGGTGWIAERPDPAALSRALSAVVAAGRDEARRRGEAGERLARERYSFDAVAERTRAVYDDVAP